MALSISPHQFNQPLPTPPLSNPLLHPHSTSTSRQYRTNDDMPDNETLLINSTFTVEPDPLQVLPTRGTEYDTREDAHNFTSASRGELDLPSWTPLKTPGDNAHPVTLDSEVDELSTANATRPPMTQPTELGQATTETPATATGILRLKSSESSDAKPTFKKKKARFDGVLITTTPSSYRLGKRSPQVGPVSAPAPSSRMRQLSLVDALARTFNANRHTEDPARRRPGAALRKGDDGSATPGVHTDADTEAEDEQLLLNTRLAHSSLKRPYRMRAILSENVSEHNSEDGTSLLSQRDAERPGKRLKPILYDAHASLVDAALGTVEAPIGWDAELDFITREDEFVLPMTSVTQRAPADAYGMEGASEPTSGLTAGQTLLQSTAATNQPYAPPRRHRILLPYLSRGAKFIQRLDTIYGENATVRTDKAARPISVDLDFYAPFDEPDDNYKASSPSPSESTASVSAASVLEEGASAVPSTHITSQSPSDVPPADTVADDVNMPVEPLSRHEHGESRHEHGEVTAVIIQPSSNSEETIGSWIIALQRLVKGKIRIREEDLETVSIILAEIESVKDNLGEDVSMTFELRESVRQLSELHEIPFGDRNKLRQRAEVIYHAWPFMKELGAF